MRPIDDAEFYIVIDQDREGLTKVYINNFIGKISVFLQICVHVCLLTNPAHSCKVVIMFKTNCLT